MPLAGTDERAATNIAPAEAAEASETEMNVGDSPSTGPTMGQHVGDEDVADEEDEIHILDVYGGPDEQEEDEEEVADRLLGAVVDAANDAVGDIDWEGVDAEAAGRGEDTDDFLAIASVVARRYPDAEEIIRSVTYPAGHYLNGYVDDEVW